MFFTSPEKLNTVGLEMGSSHQPDISNTRLFIDRLGTEDGG
jgi:hypothetical protein